MCLIWWIYHGFHFDDHFGVCANIVEAVTSSVSHSLVPPGLLCQCLSYSLLITPVSLVAMNPPAVVNRRNLGSFLMLIMASQLGTHPKLGSGAYQHPAC